MKKSNLKAPVSKVKLILSKGTAATLVSSVLFNSCVGYFDEDGYNSKGNIYGPFAPNSEHGNIFIPINESNLNEKFIRHMIDVVSLISEITTNRDAATYFRNNPTKFIAERKFDLNFEFTEDEIKLLKAYTDTDVIAAINSNDFEKFITICKDRGYIGLNLNKFQLSSSLRKYFKDEADFQNYLSTVGRFDLDDEQVRTLFVVAGAVVYIAGAVLIYGAVATIAAFWVGVTVEVGVAYSQTWIDSESRKIDSGVLRLWTKENSQLQQNILYDQLIEEQADQIVDIFNRDLSQPIQVGNKTILLTEEQIEKYRQINKDFIKSNLEGYYGLRKFR